MKFAVMASRRIFTLRRASPPGFTSTEISKMPTRWNSDSEDETDRLPVLRELAVVQSRGRQTQNGTRGNRQRHGAIAQQVVARPSAGQAGIGDPAAGDSDVIGAARGTSV
jgi:hypothetical protein